jgi:hypothetical protein
MIFSPRSDKFPELLHQTEPKGDFLRAAHERRVELDFLRTDTLAALNVLPDLCRRAGEDCLLLSDRKPTIEIIRNSDFS